MYMDYWLTDELITWWDMNLSVRTCKFQYLTPIGDDSYNTYPENQDCKYNVKTYLAVINSRVPLTNITTLL